MWHRIHDITAFVNTYVRAEHMDDANSATFSASVALVLEEARNIKELRRSARTAKLLQFAIDACLVAHGIRSGYLVDAVCPPDPVPTLTTLLMALRQKGPPQSSVFRHVVLWHHAPTAQSFLVHVPLLQQKLTALLGGSGECAFVKLDRCLSVSREPPGRLRQALHEMRCLMTESHDGPSLFLPEKFTEEILIPLAAVLIDYPVAYFPAFPTQTTFLEREELDIYTVSLRITTPGSGLEEEHVLLKFSCPQVLVGDHAELSPATVIEKLRAKFTPDLERIGMRASVTHQTEILDRVAL